MYRYITKNKGILFLAAVLLTSLMWMTSQVKGLGGPGLIERLAGAMSYPFVKTAEKTRSTAVGVWQGYFFLVGLEKENGRLMARNDLLINENLKLREALAQNRRLEGLFELKRQSGYPSVTARVVGRGASSWFNSLWVDSGEVDGVVKGMPAMVPGGLVGKVSKPYGTSSRVTLITDPASAVSCLFERSRDTAILAGDGTSLCLAHYVARHADVIVGDLLVTSGLDGVFPAGIPVGRVAMVSKESSGYFLDVRVSPTADLDHLEELLIIKHEPQAFK